MEIDPVCKMKMQPAEAAAQADYAGQVYYFCPDACHKAFVAEPQKYVAGMPQGGAYHHGQVVF